MIGLPMPPRVAWLKGFWLTMSCGAGLLVGVVAVFAVSPAWFALGAVVAAALAGPGLYRPEIANIPYRAWNRLAVWLARRARDWMLWVYLKVLFGLAGRAGHSLGLERPPTNESLWRPHSASPVAGDNCRNGVTIEPQGGRRWARAFLAQARRDGNGWMRWLLPLVAVVRVLDDAPREEAPPTGIYTLY
ncbi:MAG TPA: hypothetical protein VL486_04430 [Verrucomicrobiae bacterium]|nr:hypothetical protein [Verrucomicrobiae bacterium]